MGIFIGIGNYIGRHSLIRPSRDPDNEYSNIITEKYTAILTEDGFLILREVEYNLSTEDDMAIITEDDRYILQEDKITCKLDNNTLISNNTYLKNECN